MHWSKFSTKLIIAILIVITQTGFAYSQGDKLQMHRTQVTAKHPSGWNFAKSTKGNFSVLLPIPFNDFSINSPKGRIDLVGGNSPNGVKFIVTKMPANNKCQTANAEGFAKRIGGNTKKIRSFRLPIGAAFDLNIVRNNSGAYFRYVKTKTTCVMMILEYPITQSNYAEKVQSKFFESLKLKY